MKIGKLFRKESAGSTLSSIGSFRLGISHSTLIHFSLLAIILVIAATIRLLPLRWGYQLSEFDPHIHYRATKFIVENGLNGYTSWIDPMSWYPGGYDISTAILPGLATTAAVFYQIANALNLAPGPVLGSAVYHPLNADPIFNFCVIFPVIMATLTVLVMYFVGKDIGGKGVGLFSAFFLAVSAAYISRTSLGFFDDENIGIFGILLFVFFFLRSIDQQRSNKGTITYGALGGLSLGYLFASWGAARYPLGIVLVFVFVLLILRRYSTRLLLSYATTFAVGLLIAINVPKLGVGFLVEPTVLATAGMFLLLVMYEVSTRITVPKNKLMFVVGFLTLIVVVFAALAAFNLMGPLGEKFLTVINPGQRLGETPTQQLVQSVQEHRPSTWGSYYYDLGIGALFVPIGLFFILQKPTNRNIFVAIFGLTAIYFAGSMARLSLLLAPAVSIIWALALVQLVKPFAEILRDDPKVSRRKKRFLPKVGKEFSAGFIGLLLLLLTVNFVLPADSASYSRTINRAYSPTTIAASSLPLRAEVSYWLDSLNWMRTNLNSSTVVAAWWDYGYWITTIGNVTTLADNGTVNTTQIGKIGEMFVSNETASIQILEDFDAEYVTLFMTFDRDGNDIGYGDEGKWRWMARIAGLDDKKYGNYSLGQDWVDANQDGSVADSELVVNELGNSSVLYKLMHYARDMVISGSSNIVLEHFEEAFFTTPELYPTSDGGYFTAMVCVYKVIY
ncbi:MAG: hypothetical protein IAX21_05390 [Candidatus Bathyarchaeota archaeon]|nr:STT3 domain-containing protein [Candidatus Bathyarchaeum tardum]WNZ30279.1 MAG: hypothetical protein IAX21_05390 [Candidatus Bathyarchaeota archaeon]